MERIKTLGALKIIGILTSLLVACGGGGGPSQGDSLGVTAQNGNTNPGGSSSADDTPSIHDDSGGGNGSGNTPGGPADHSGGSNDTFDLPVSTAFNSQQLSRVVYEPEQDQFLVIWNDLRNRGSFDYYGWAVYGQFVNSGGGFLGQNFPISPQGVEYRSAPIAAYDAATGRSLVVWGTTGGDVLGQMVNPDGTLFGEVIPIATSSDYEVVPALAFDPNQGRFLVAWLDSSIGYKIYGQLLGREGSLQGIPFLISEVSSGKLELQAAADTDIGRFLLVWRDYRGVDIYSIYGQMVNSNGTLYGNEIIIADAIGSQIAPSLAYDPVNRTFLVTWSDDRRFGGSRYEIYGQIVAEDGVLISSNFFISPYGGYSHSVAFESTNPHYLIAFPKYGNRIHVQYVAADGTVTDEAFPLSDMESTQGTPHLAYDTKHQRFLTAWTDHRNASADIYGQTTLLSARQDPCDGQSDSVAPGCLSQTDVSDQVNAICNPDLNWANHGEYVSCVAREVRRLRVAGSMSAQTALQLVNEAARSDVGKKQ